MRFLAPLALCLIACSSDPVAPPLDAAADTASELPTDAPSQDVPADVLVADAQLDVLADVAPSIDAQPDGDLDAGARDVAADVFVADAVADVAPSCDVRCDGGCIDTDFDPLNCGGCGVVCHSALAHVRPRCFVGTCEFPCAAGYGDCDGNARNGCETFVMGTDNANCGGCRATCNTSKTCMAGVCRGVH